MMMMVQWSWLLLVLWLKRKKRVGEREAGILQKVKSTVERESKDGNCKEERKNKSAMVGRINVKCMTVSFFFIIVTHFLIYFLFF